MRFEFDDLNRGHTDAQVLDDLRRVAREVGRATVSMAEYQRRGKYNRNTVARRFGGWNLALAAAGLEVGHHYNTSEEDLFKNLAAVWNALGRQPSRGDMRRPLSRFSGSAYEYRFGGWGRALRAFVAAMGEGGTEQESLGDVASVPSRPRSLAAPGWRVRFLVMRRDRFRCRACGRSPATEPGVRLAVDHVKPRSQGGETVMENLQTLCEPCNGGKSDLAWEET